MQLCQEWLRIQDKGEHPGHALRTSSKNECTMGTGLGGWRARIGII